MIRFIPTVEQGVGGEFSDLLDEASLSMLSQTLETELPEAKLGFPRSDRRYTVNVNIITRDTIRRLNNSFRGRDQATDVLSFAMHEDGLLGELYISPETLYNDDELEIFRLIVHGTLHILGYEHDISLDKWLASPARYKIEMFEIQEAVMKRFGKLKKQDGKDADRSVSNRTNPLYIVGLGNPGNEYEQTPHNAGFEAVNKLYELLSYDRKLNVGDWKYDKYIDGDIATVRQNGREIYVLVKPMTYMNRAGKTVRELIKRFEFDPTADLVVVYDDLDIPLGKYKLQKAKKPKAHNGINDIVSQIGAMDFQHLRIGVETRARDRKISGEEYVVRKLPDADWQTLLETVQEAVSRFEV